MLREELYTSFNEKILLESSSTYVVKYVDLREIFDEFIDMNKNKEKYANLDDDYVQLGYLFSMTWGMRSLAVSKRKDGNLIWQSLFGTIANSSLAIIKLSTDGLDYQANILLRNLYELCFTLLNIMIDKEKRIALFESGKNANAIDVWRKYFKSSKLGKTLEEYETRINLKRLVVK